MSCETFFIISVIVIMYMTYIIIWPEDEFSPLKKLKSMFRKEEDCGCDPTHEVIPQPPHKAQSSQKDRQGAYSCNQGMFGGTKNKGTGDLPELAAMEGFAGMIGDVGQVSSYDPIQMGAIKQSEVDSHYNNLKDRSPFSAVGVTSASSVRRDDDPYMRDSGVPWVGGIPRRAFKGEHQGPQGGARQTISASAESLDRLSKEASSSKSWDVS